jgi:hypothetical protein
VREARHGSGCMFGSGNLSTTDSAFREVAQ